MGEIVIGTIDLSTLCGCVDPCETCCDVTVDCCANAIPMVLQASFANGGGACSCVTGATSYPMTWDGAAWVTDGAVTIDGCGNSISLSMYCAFTAGFNFLMDVGGCQTSTGNASVAHICSPLQVTFQIPVATCCSGAAGTLNVIVTE